MGKIKMNHKRICENTENEHSQIYSAVKKLAADAECGEKMPRIILIKGVIIYKVD